MNWNRVVTLNQVPAEPITQAVGQPIPEWTTIGGGENAFPQEYSISGWFRWGGPYTVEWHLIMRFTIVPRADN